MTANKDARPRRLRLLRLALRLHGPRRRRPRGSGVRPGADLGHMTTAEHAAQGPRGWKTEKTQKTQRGQICELPRPRGRGIAAPPKDTDLRNLLEGVCVFASSASSWRDLHEGLRRHPRSAGMDSRMCAVSAREDAEKTQKTQQTKPHRESSQARCPYPGSGPLRVRNRPDQTGVRPRRGLRAALAAGYAGWNTPPTRTRTPVARQVVGALLEGLHP